MDLENGTVDLELEFIHQTELAYLLTDGDSEEWVAKSLSNPIDVDPVDLMENQTYAFQVVEWAAKENGWI